MCIVTDAVLELTFNFVPLVDNPYSHEAEQMPRQSFSSPTSIQQHPAIPVPWTEDTKEVRVPILCRGDLVGRRAVHLFFAFASAVRFFSSAILVRLASLV